MALKQILGLEETDISDSEIMSKIVYAQRNRLDSVEFIKKDGEIITINIPHMDFDTHMLFN